MERSITAFSSRVTTHQIHHFSGEVVCYGVGIKDDHLEAALRISKGNINPVIAEMLLPRGMSVSYKSGEGSFQFSRNFGIEGFKLNGSSLYSFNHEMRDISVIKIGDEYKFMTTTESVSVSEIHRQVLVSKEFPEGAKSLDELPPEIAAEVLSAIQFSKKYDKEANALINEVLEKEAMSWIAHRATGQEVPEAAPSDEECREFVRQQVALRKLINPAQGKALSAA